MRDIEALIHKYKSREKKLMAELSSVRDNLATLAKAAELLGKKLNPLDVIDQLPTRKTRKYETLSMKNAILDLLSAGKEITGKEVLNGLVENGYKSASKSLQGDIYGQLNQLIADNKVKAFKEGKGVRTYKIVNS